MGRSCSSSPTICSIGRFNSVWASFKDRFGQNWIIFRVKNKFCLHEWQLLDIFRKIGRLFMQTSAHTGSMPQRPRTQMTVFQRPNFNGLARPNPSFYYQGTTEHWTPHTFPFSGISSSKTWLRAGTKWEQFGRFVTPFESR